MLRMRLIIAALLMTGLTWGTWACALDVPSMAAYRLSWDSLLNSEVHQGVIIEIRDNHTFILNEKPYIILQESEIDGIPAANSTIHLRTGMKVRVTSYRLPNKTNFASDITTIFERR